MTGLQAEYSKILETRRHNLATESQGERQLGIQQQQADTQAFSAQENARHNLATEALGTAQLKETIRHQKQQDAETMRHNQVSEAEITRHNVAMERQAIADNNVKLAIAELNNETSERIADKQLENSEWRTKYEASVKQKIANLDRALEEYKANTSLALKRDELQLQKDNMYQEWRKIDADISQIENNISARNKELEQADRKLAISERSQDLAEAKAGFYMTGKAKAINAASKAEKDVNSLSKTNPVKILYNAYEGVANPIGRTAKVIKDVAALFEK